MLKSILKSILGGISSNQTAPAQTASTTSNEVPVYTYGKNEDSVMINGYNYSKRFHVTADHFRPILTNHFSNYEIRENVPVNAVFSGASDAFKPFNYTMSLNGSVVAVIAVCDKKTSSKRASELCEKAGIKYITFYSMYENTEKYVVERINKFLSK